MEAKYRTDRESPPARSPGSLAEENELVGRAQSGDVAAYEELVRRHQRRVFAVVASVLRGREDIEDVAQQVLLKVYISLKRFDRRSAFSTWLYKIAVNESRDYLRKKRVRRLSYEADLSEEQLRQLDAVANEAMTSAVSRASADFARRAELRELVERLLREVSDEDRMILVLKEVEGFSVEEIGGILGLNVNTVKVRLFRARGKLTAVYRKRLRGSSPRESP